MPALFCNLRINCEDKFDIFKVTFKDIVDFFQEFHIKIRGNLANKCIDFINENTSAKVNFYQGLGETDWITTSLEMLEHVQSRSVFLYFEDHRLVSSKEAMKNVLEQFDHHQLDYLCYSFFLASRLTNDNLLPLGPSRCEMFDYFKLSNTSLSLLGKIAPSSYTFSLMSICSTRYFKNILFSENAGFFIYNETLNSIARRLFPYPLSKIVYRRINKFLAFIRMRLCMHPPSSPFNTEKMWMESELKSDTSFQFGVLREELYANFDDDNGVYGESLVKKGLYPFAEDKFNNDIFKSKPAVTHRIKLKQNEIYDCTYYSNHYRISQAPIVSISIILGEVEVSYKGSLINLSQGMENHFYSNLHPLIKSRTVAEVDLKIYDNTLK